MLVFLAALLLPSPIRAGEVEEEVISANWEAFLADESTEAEPYLSEAYAIANDTVVDSYCETYASAIAWVIAVYEDVEAATEYDVEVYSAMVTATEVVYAELDRLQTQCLNEE